MTNVVDLQGNDINYQQGDLVRGFIDVIDKVREKHGCTVCDVVGALEVAKAEYIRTQFYGDSDAEN